MGGVEQSSLYDPIFAAGYFWRLLTWQDVVLPFWPSHSLFLKKVPDNFGWPPERSVVFLFSAQGDCIGLIPTRLNFDFCPFTFSDGTDEIGPIGDGVPGVTASVEDGLVGFPDLMTECVAA